MGSPGLACPRAWEAGRPKFSTASRTPRTIIVTIYLPDGTKEQFLMGFTGVTYTFAGPPLATTSIFFVPVPGTGTTGTLAALTNNNVIVSPAQVGPVTFIDQSTGQVYNPTRWKYTGQDGTSYIIDADKRHREHHRPNGPRLDTSPRNGIKSSDGQGLTIARDSQGRVTSITDPMGKSITYGYDFYGDLVDRHRSRRQRHPLHLRHQPSAARGLRPARPRGERTEYDDSGRIVEVINAFGQSVSLQHDLVDRVEHMTDALGNVTTAAYDLQGNVIDQIDALGGVTNYTYDSQNHMTSTTDPLGNTTYFTYDSNGNVLTKTDPMGAKTTNVYDARGNIALQTLPNGAVVQNQYDSDGALSFAIDGAGNKTTYSHNSLGEVASTTNALGQTTSFSYDSNGHLQSQVDPQGQQTVFDYDANGRLIGTVDYINGQPFASATIYDANGKMTGSIDPTNNTKFYNYDPLGNLTAITDSAGNVVAYKYNALGLLTEIDNPDGTVQVQYEYNANKQKTAQIDALGRRTSYVYDALGRQIEVINPDASTTFTQYDAAGHVIATIDELGRKTQYQYDAAGNRIAVIDALGNVTHIEYTPATLAAGFGEPSRSAVLPNRPAGKHDQVCLQPDRQPDLQTYADGSGTSSTYDALGRTLSTTDPVGNTTTYQYGAQPNTTIVIDPLGRQDDDDLPERKRGGRPGRQRQRDPVRVQFAQPGRRHDAPPGPDLVPALRRERQRHPDYRFRWQHDQVQIRCPEPAD